MVAHYLVLEEMFTLLNVVVIPSNILPFFPIYGINTFLRVKISFLLIANVHLPSAWA